MPRADDLKVLVHRLGQRTPPGRLSLAVDSSGYVDMRGLEIPSVREPDLEGLVLDHVDFTGSNFENTRWVDCEFTHVKFDRINGFGMNFTNSRIRHSSFVRADLHRANWGWKDPPDPLIEDCPFEHADLRQTTYGNPLFSRCRFSHCNFNNTRFTARFEDCVFEGVVEGVGFSGYFLDVVGVSSDKGYSRKFVWNSMRNVDFSRADLRHVAFCGGIDLLTSKLPEGDYLRVPDPRKAYAMALEAIRTTWPEERGRKVGKYLEDLLRTCFNRDQPFDLVRPEDFVEYFGEEAGRALVEELKRAIQS